MYSSTIIKFKNPQIKKDALHLYQYLHLQIFSELICLFQFGGEKFYFFKELIRRKFDLQLIIGAIGNVYSEGSKGLLIWWNICCFQWSKILNRNIFLTSCHLKDSAFSDHFKNLMRADFSDICISKGYLLRKQIFCFSNVYGSLHLQTFVCSPFLW